MLIDFKDEEFETKIKNEDISVVQFSAEWCAPVSYTHLTLPTIYSV